MDRQITLNMKAMCFRLNTLMTHYRKPLDFSQRRMDEAEKILTRWLKVIEICDQGPPIEVLTALTNDCNTPGVIAELHKYRGNGEGKKLYASMKFLGFFDGVCEPDEVKTIPRDQIPNTEPGPQTSGLTQ